MEAEARFEAGRAELRAPFLNEAKGRAEQAVAELARKYGERQRTLRDLASRHEAESVDAALTLLPTRPHDFLQALARRAGQGMKP